MREIDASPSVSRTRKGIKSVPATTPPNTAIPKLYIGPAGWITPTGRGWSISRGSRARHRGRLTSRVRLFWGGAVEINVTFYRPIPPIYARRWLAEVQESPDFRFTAKVWQIFTNADCRSRTGPVPEGLAPLLIAGGLGVLPAQFSLFFP